MIKNKNNPCARLDEYMDYLGLFFSAIEEADLCTEQRVKNLIQGLIRLNHDDEAPLVASYVGTSGAVLDKPILRNTSVSG